MQPSQANNIRLPPGAARFVLAFICAAVTLTPAAARITSDPTTEHDQCVAQAETDPEAALARARQWSNSGGGFDADHCAAMALFDLNHYAEAAAAFEKLAHGMGSSGLADQAAIYDQAGQAWLLANRPRAAKADLDAALRLTPNDPDLLIDRAEMLAAARDYWGAVDDLNRASDIAPNKADIYAYRAAAYRALEALPLARQDIDRNLKLAPNNPVGLLERGNIERIQGDVAAARRDWVSVTRIAPDSAAATAAENNLVRLGKIREKVAPRKRGGSS